MRAHLLKHPAALLAALSALVVLVFGASVAQASVFVAHGTRRGDSIASTYAVNATVLGLIVVVLVVGAVIYAVASDRRLVAAPESSSKLVRLPDARSDGRADETRKAA
jgi:hypothetical protein